MQGVLLCWGLPRGGRLQWWRWVHNDVTVAMAMVTWVVVLVVTVYNGKGKFNSNSADTWHNQRG